jgi:hypothetical protein
MREDAMELRNPKSIEKALRAGIGKVRGVDGDEVHDYLDECVGGIAAHHVTGNTECGRVKDLDHWEAQVDGFEAGLRIGAAMADGDRVFTAYLDPDEDDLPAGMCFYFVGRDAGGVVKELRDGTSKWLDGLRKEKGLLPFKD